MAGCLTHWESATKLIQNRATHSLRTISTLTERSVCSSLCPPPTSLTILSKTVFPTNKFLRLRKQILSSSHGITQVLPSFQETSNTPVATATHDLAASKLGSEEFSHESDKEQVLAAGAEEDDEDGEREEESESAEDVQQESLRVLEWPLLCRQLAPFTSTAMARSVAERAELSLGESLSHSRILLAQTAACLEYHLPCDTLAAVQDLRWTLLRAETPGGLSLEDLCAVGSTLDAVQRLLSQLRGSDEGSWPPPAPEALLAIFQGSDPCPALLAELKRCLEWDLHGVLLDGASQALGEVRVQRQENQRELRVLLRDVAAELAAQGATEGSGSAGAVVQRRGRACVGVKAGFRNLLPGGVTLDVSNSGATLFIEPRNATWRNNLEAQLAAREDDEAEAVLRQLSRQVACAAPALLNLLCRVTDLDLAGARALHATWMGSVAPTLVAHSPAARWRLHIPALRHPLLLAPSLPPPGQRPSSPLPPPPVPVDFLLPSASTAVVVLSGSNTGGKTACLKALAMAALMARAGMYLPAGTGEGGGGPRLPWFRDVLADIGDEQSLQQSLSTFSGHVRRLKRILATAGDASLVLLDEVGSGTDPAEGASLATAVLRQLATLDGLTVATTHYAELSALKKTSDRFENACVEFDLQTLKPTFRLLWGTAGQSNAFAIAAGRGFDRKVLRRSRELLESLRPADAESRAELLIGPLAEQRRTFVMRARKTKEDREEAEREYGELRHRLEELNERDKEIKAEVLAEVDSHVEEARKKMQEQVERLEKTLEENSLSSSSGSASSGSESEDENSGKDGKGRSRRKNSKRMGRQREPTQTDERLQKLFEEAVKEVVRIGKEYSVSPQGIMKGFVAQGEAEGGGKPWLPIVGEKVIVRRLGSTPVTVLEESRDKGDFIVQFGMMRVTVKAEEILPIVGQKVRGREEASEARRVTKVKFQRKNEGSDGISSLGGIVYDARVQTSKNTVDLRGENVEDGLHKLDIEISSRPRGSVIYIIHGLGTGYLKEAVIGHLRSHSAIAKFEPESIANSGCTVAYIQ